MLTTLPVIKLFAIVGWLGALAVLLSPATRNWLLARLRMPSPSSQNVLLPLDSIRGLAAVWVSIFHYWQWTRPYFDDARSLLPMISTGERAVPLFCLLSGFLIWRAAQAITTRDDLTRYAHNRFLRIFPLYAAVTAVLFFTGQMGHEGSPVRNLIADVLMGRVFGFPLFAAPQAWSLYVEVLFYFVVPILAAGFNRRPISLTLLLLVLFAASEYSLSPREFMLWKFFLFGILAAEIFDRYHAALGQTLAGILFLAGTALLLFVGLHLDEMMAAKWGLPPPGDDRYRFNLGLAFALIVLGAIRWKPASVVLSLAPLRALGVVSYSVFMWHGVLILFDFPITFDGRGHLQPSMIGPMPVPVAPLWELFGIVLPGLISCGIISFLCIELPFLRLRRRGTMKHVTVAGD